MRAVFSGQFWLHAGLGLSFLAASLAFAQPVEARQGAPITYAAQAPASAPNDLAGGADGGAGAVGSAERSEIGHGAVGIEEGVLRAGAEQS